MLSSPFPLSLPFLVVHLWNCQGSLLLLKYGWVNSGSVFFSVVLVNFPCLYSLPTRDEFVFLLDTLFWGLDVAQWVSVAVAATLDHLASGLSFFCIHQEFFYDFVNYLESLFTPPGWSVTCYLRSWVSSGFASSLCWLPPSLPLFLPSPIFLLAPCGYVWGLSSLSSPPYTHHCWRYLVWLLFLWSMAFTAVFLLAEKHQHSKICFSCLVERGCGKGRAFVILGISISLGCLHPFCICLSLNLGA